MEASDPCAAVELTPVAREGLYETDFFAWTQKQAEILKGGRLASADVLNILEEIQTLGRKELSELRSRYKILAIHLLKEIYQPAKATRSWKTTILNQRIEIARHMADNPSLKSRADGIFVEAYADARLLVASETGLPVRTFPAKPPFDREQASSRSFRPGVVAEDVDVVKDGGTGRR